ncbi:MAG: hypothetical protein GXP63_01170 [DPANN group archaeon]|nr:hypothetical protein [DPANN group archaeon]
MDFLNPLGLLGFLFLIPLIIIYLRRPRPKKKALPSLMFLMKDEKRVQRSMLRRLLRNLLFFLQLLILSLLVLAMADPQIPLESSAQPGHVVWVLDISASSQARYGNKAAFDYFRDYIKAHPASSNSLILLGDQPRLVLDKASPSALKDTLDRLSPTDLPSNLGDSIIAASSLLQQGTGKVIVVSDMMPTTGSDIQVAQKTLESRNTLVEFENPLPDKELDNVGLIGLSFDRTDALVTVKNYDTKTLEISVSLRQGDETKSSQTVTLRPDSVEQLTFATFPGKNTVRIDRDDDFPADNTLFIYNPLANKESVLYISNTTSGYLLTALYAMPFLQVRTAIPPIIPQEPFDFIIIDSFEGDKILPGTFPSILRQVEGGSTLVLIASDALMESPLQDELPVIIASKKEKAATLYPATKSYGLDEMDFGQVHVYWDAILKEKAVLLADTDTSVPLIALRKKGLGSVLYVGFREDQADFRLTPSFPIFWSRILKRLGNIESIGFYHRRTGSFLAATDADGRQLLSRRGFVSFRGKTLAVNLLDEQESDVNNHHQYASSRLTDLSGQKDLSLQFPLMSLALLLVLVELSVVKFRGDV